MSDFARARAPTAPRQLVLLPDAVPIDEAPPIVDVWSRTAPKYRVRAFLLLAFNLLLYCGLCIFTHWLHVGRALDFSLESYLSPARFWSPDAPNLYDFIRYPINVEQTPIQAVVLGLLVASIVATPIVIAILYRLPSALPFVASVLVFAHMPWLAFTLLASAIVASIKPFRLRFRFASALLGMLPVLAYLFLATRGGAEELTAASPIGKTLLAAPWILAIIAASVMLGVVLYLARLVDYRPGAVTPVVMVMFATPVVLFHARIGVDELSYRVLESEYGPRSTRFQPIRDIAEQLREYLQVWTNSRDSFVPHLPDLAAFIQSDDDALAARDLFRQRIRHRLITELLTERAAAYEACRLFIADHPDSRYKANVLYIQARAMDTRLDLRRFGQGAPRIELYSDFPHVQSEPIWRALWTEHPNSPLSITAGLRLAQLSLRRGEIDAAAVLLDEVERRARELPPHPLASQPSGQPLLIAATPESTLSYDPDLHCFEARRLAELIASNRDDAAYGNDPLVALASLDPRRESYPEQLLRLAARYPNSLLYDNLLVLWAVATPSVTQRAERLAACAEKFPTGDARPQALFQLADLEVQALSGGNEEVRRRGLDRLRLVLESFGSSVWGRAAADRLQLIRPTALLPTNQPS